MTIERASDNPFPSILLVEGTEPAAPAAGRQRLYVDSTTHLLKLTDSAGADTTVGSGLADPMTTRGDIIVRNASNATARLGRGSASQVLTSDGTDVAWATPSAGASATVSSNYMTADVTMTTANTYYDGPSLSLANGTYLLMGGVAYHESSTGSYFQVKLWDGTTSISHMVGRTENGVDLSVFVAGTYVVTGGPKTLKISGSCNAAGRLMIRTAANGATNQAGYLIALKIA